VTIALTALLALSTGWIWGHATARIIHVPIGGRRADDEAALNAADTDIPDDPTGQAA
jgi:hypothetical protein